MSQPPLDEPPQQPQQTEPPSGAKPSSVKPTLFPFGLSADEFAHVTREMLNAARLVCRHSSASATDAVQQAFVKALSKPDLKQSSIKNRKKFVAWMCTLAKYEAMTNRKSHQRRARREVACSADITELVAVPHSADAVEARKMLQEAFVALESTEQALLHALYFEGKTIEDVAREQRLPWSTVDSRRKRLLKRLYAAIHGALAAFVLLLPKKARAFVTQVTQQVAQFSGIATVTAVCGVFVPSGSSVMTEPSTPPGLTPVSTEQANTTKDAYLEPIFTPKVAPEEPKALDAATNTCSAADMKFTKVAISLHETLVPLAFLVAPAFAQVGCAGTAQQTPVASEPGGEERDDSVDPYVVMCSQERARGNACPTKEEWLKEIGAQ